MSSHTNNGNNGGGTTGVLQRCVSLANGALSPDLRVNYEFGLVLGVDEFRQEQLYFLEKDRLHQRSLHGYGAVYGLGVTATRPADATDEMLIAVEPGMGVDQFGRTILLREEQCARLGAWLARQIQAGTAPVLGPLEDYRVYVVATYDECAEALVPIAGQACSVAENSQAPSRIRDAFQIDLRWQPPPMSAWDAVRAFADLLARVRLVPGLAPELSEEADVIALVRGLAEPPAMELCTEEAAGSPPLGSPPPGSPPAEVLRLPAETARQALDRIFNVWVTEVRPVIRDQANLTDPGDDTQVESGILLACIDFAPVAGFNPASPAIDHAGVSYGGRPFLLHTQLIQELLLLGNGDYAPNLAEHEFANLQVLGGHTVRAWLNHPAPLDIVASLTSPIELSGDGGPLTVANVTAVAGTNNLYEVTTAVGTAGLIRPGGRLEAVFNLDAWEQRGGTPLIETLAALNFSYEGRVNGTIHVRTVVDGILPSRDLVTYTVEREPQTGRLRLFAWFHTDQPVRLPAQLPVRRAPGGSVSQFATAPRQSGQQFSFHWELTPPTGETLNEGDTLLSSYDARAVGVGNNQVTLAEVIAEQHLSIVGYDGSRVVQTYFQIAPLPAGQTQPGPSIDEIIEAVAALLPALPFVSIQANGATRVLPGSNQPVRGLDFEMWFHLDVDPREDFVHIQERPDFQAFAELQGGPGAGSPAEVTRFRLVDNPKPNVFTFFITLADYRIEAQLSPYLRFAFATGNMLFNEATGDQFSVEEYIRRARIKFQGHNGRDVIVAYVRLPQGDLG